MVKDFSIPRSTKLSCSKLDLLRKIWLKI